MDKSLLFSIVIPTYNRARLLPKTIQSVLAQTYSLFEVLIVDDGSTDNTQEVVAQFQDPRIKYYAKKNEERAVARNFGTQHATGQYVYFLDSDDILYPNHLAEAVNFIDKQDKPPIFFLPYEIVNGSGGIVRSIVPLSDSLNKILLTEGNILSCHGVFLRMDVAKTYPFNEDRELSGSEDYELWLRIANHHEIPYSQTVTSALVHHDERSVLNFNIEKLIHRKELMLHYLSANEEFVKQNEKYLPHLKANAYLYIALHLALTKKHKKEAIHWLSKALRQRPASIFVPSFWGTLKHLA